MEQVEGLEQGDFALHEQPDHRLPLAAQPRRRQQRRGNVAKHRPGAPVVGLRQRAAGTAPAD